MSTNPLQDLLNKYIWVQGKNHIRINYRHRVEKDTVLNTIKGIDVRRVSSRGIELSNGTIIPYHRVHSVYELGATKRWLMYGEQDGKPDKIP